MLKKINLPSSSYFILKLIKTLPSRENVAWINILYVKPKLSRSKTYLSGLESKHRMAWFSCRCTLVDCVPTQFVFVSLHLGSHFSYWRIRKNTVGISNSYFGALFCCYFWWLKMYINIILLCLAGFHTIALYAVDRNDTVYEHKINKFHIKHRITTLNIYMEHFLLICCNMF